LAKRWKRCANMISVEVLAVGRELLIGKTVDTNAHWVGGRLAKMGGMIRRIITVTDSLGEISSALREILSRRPDFVIIIGGLGPTPDDMTLRGVARTLGRRLKIHSEAIQMIKNHYESVWKNQFVLTPARKKMATLPAGAVPQRNPVGSAPGVRLEEGGSVIYCLPGVPREMKAIFRRSVEKEIQKRIGQLFTKTVVMDLEDIFESSLAPLLRQAMRDFPQAYIKSHPKGIREGRSHIELDLAVTDQAEEKSTATILQLAEFLSQKIKESKGTIVRRKGPL